MFKGQKGITLIALVITIIVLLILAGVSIMMLSGAENAPEKGGEAVIRDAIGGGKDAVVIAVSNATIDYYNQKYVNSAAESSAEGNTIDEVVYNAAIKATADKVTISKGSTDGSTVKVAYTADDKYYVEGTIEDGAITWEEIQGFTK